MRERFLGEFDRLWLDNMNGDSRETGKRTPDGKPDPSVFSTEYNKAGIRVGTTVSLLVRKLERDEKPLVRYRQFWGSSKRADLLNSLNVPNINNDYQPILPVPKNRYSFRPSKVTVDYLAWPSVEELTDFKPTLGILENRKEALIDIDKHVIENRMKAYYDPNTSWEELVKLNTGLTQNAARYDAEQTGRGVVCLISNFSYLSDPSFVVMRERFLGEFDRLWVDNMNGDSRETGKRTPDGKPDPSVFSTEYNKAGIRVGTTVSLLVRKLEREEKPLVRFRQFWGRSKRADLLNSLNVPNINSDYQSLQPVQDNRYSFRPSEVSTDYLSWPRLT